MFPGADPGICVREGASPSLLSCTSITTVQWDSKVSVLLWLERRRPAQSERHTESNTSVVIQRDFFQVVEVVKNKDILNSSSQLPTVNS